MATVCGHFPLTLVTGPGAAARNSIGLVLVAGMAIGTTFTLFLVPAIYLLIARERGAVERVRAAPKLPGGGAPSASPLSPNLLGERLGEGDGARVPRPAS